METILRIWLDAGHGLSNARPNVFDTGATSCYGSEHEIVYRITDLVADHFWRDEQAEVEVIEVPQCSTACVAKHPKSSHLAYKIHHINGNLKRRPNGRAFAEVVLSLHMNSADTERATGTEVLYSHNAGDERARIARAISAAVASTLGTVNRGALSDRDSARGSIAILNRTECPAYLIELGFVSNPDDVRKVRDCGLEAVLAAIRVIVKEHAK